MNASSPSVLFDGLLTEAERRFGPRARPITIKVVARDDTIPESLPDGPHGCVAYFAKEADGDYFRLRFQLAHEAIHVLSGALKRTSTYLEEGFAVWFSLNLAERNFPYDHQAHASLPKLFKTALKLFKKLKPQDHTLKVFRSQNPNLDLITAHQLKSVFSISR